MSKKIKKLIGKLGVGMILLSYLLTGCLDKDTAKSTEIAEIQKVNLDVNKTETILKEINDTTEKLTNVNDTNTVKAQITTDLSHMEAIKMKAAFHGMIDDIDSQNTINDLQSIYNEGIICPRDFDNDDTFVISSSTLGEIFEQYPINNEGKKILNTSKVEQRKKLEQKYKGQSIPVDESGVIGLLADDLFAPQGLGIQVFNGYHHIKMDAIGMVDLSRLHIRFKGDNLQMLDICLKTSSEAIPMPAFEWFEDTYEGEKYWNAVFFEISDLKELEEAYLVLKYIEDK